MFDVGEKLQLKKDTFIAEIITRDLSNKRYTLMVNGSKVVLDETAIDLLLDIAKPEEKKVFKLDEIQAKIEPVVEVAKSRKLPAKKAK